MERNSGPRQVFLPHSDSFPNLPLAVMLLQLLLQEETQWSWAIKLQALKTQSLVSMSVAASLRQCTIMHQHLLAPGIAQWCRQILHGSKITCFSLAFSKFSSHRTHPIPVDLLLALEPEQVLREPPESDSQLCVKKHKSIWNRQFQTK